MGVRYLYVARHGMGDVAYRERSGPTTPPATAVLVQRLVDADVAGVLFTGPTARIEASWGLGVGVVAGQVTPDSWVVTNGKVVHRTIGSKGTRTDRMGTQVVTNEVPPIDRDHPCLTGADVLKLAALGRQIEGLFGQPQDVEWAIADGRTWILQARPITATLPVVTQASSDASATSVLTGTPASPGIAAGQRESCGARTASPACNPATSSCVGPQTRPGPYCSQSWLP